MILRNCLAVIGCVFALSGAAYSQTQGEAQKSDSQQQHPNPEQPKPTATQAPVGGPTVQPEATNQAPTEAKIYQPDCGKPANQPDADLCTQRRVADAAEKALQYTLAQTIIGALGVAFVVVTLGFTARANKAAAIAAQAAVDAVNAERAWMIIGDMGMAYAPSINDEGVRRGPGLVGHISWINKGRSPALEVRVHRYYQITPLGADFPEFELEPDNNPTGVVGPDRLVHANQFALYGQDSLDFRSRRNQVAIFTRITYRAVGSPSVVRHTEFSGIMVFASEWLDGDKLNIATQTSVAGSRNTAS